MKPNSTVLSRLAELESKLDAHLFGFYRSPKDGQYYRQDGGEATAEDYAKAGVRTAGMVGGGVGAYKAAQAVGNRMSGMRATIPGFAQKSTVGQVAGAAGSLATDAGSAIANSGVGKEVAYHGTRIGRAVENAVAGAAQSSVGREAAYQGTKVARHVENAAARVGSGLKRVLGKSGVTLSATERLRELSAKLDGK